MRFNFINNFQSCETNAVNLFESYKNCACRTDLKLVSTCSRSSERVIATPAKRLAKGSVSRVQIPTGFGLFLLTGHTWPYLVDAGNSFHRVKLLEREAVHPTFIDCRV